MVLGAQDSFSLDFLNDDLHASDQIAFDQILAGVLNSVNQLTDDTLENAPHTNVLSEPQINVANHYDDLSFIEELNLYPMGKFLHNNFMEK